MEPTTEAGINNDLLWELDMDRYDLTDTSQWFHCRSKDIFQQMDMIQSKKNPALLYRLDGRGDWTESSRHVSTTFSMISKIEKVETGNYEGIDLEKDTGSFEILIYQDD